MNKRKKLPNRRISIGRTLRVDHLKYHTTVSYFEDGSIGEVFMTAGKPGTGVHTLSRDLGILVSLLLQYECPVEVIRAALTRNPPGEADGPLGILLDIEVANDK